MDWAKLAILPQKFARPVRRSIVTDYYPQIEAGLHHAPEYFLAITGALMQTSPKH